MCCCSAGESDYVRRLDRGRRRYKPQGKPIISHKSLHHQVHPKQGQGSKPPVCVISQQIKLALSSSLCCDCVKPTEWRQLGTQVHVNVYLYLLGGRITSTHLFVNLKVSRFPSGGKSNTAKTLYLFQLFMLLYCIEFLLQSLHFTDNLGYMSQIRESRGEHEGNSHGCRNCSPCFLASEFLGSL